MSSNIPINPFKPPRKQGTSSYVSQTYLSDLAQFCPSVSIYNEKSSNDEFEKLENQVAGHQFEEGEDSIGMLKCKNGTVLKPITKLNVGFREIRFYQQLQNTRDPKLLELREFTPKFYGTRILDINNKKTEFIILENLLEEFCEPCIMDVKIGRQTWDQLATECKIAKEKEKYKQCKEAVGFCIPGFQVYKLPTGRLYKYNKEYGKKLNGITVSEALRTFLNGDGSEGVNRELLMQLLTTLWKIQKWARTQTSVRLYATSLLIVYDFKVLRNMVMNPETSPTHHLPGLLNPVQRKTSFTTPSYSVNRSDNFNGDAPAIASYRNSACARMNSNDKQSSDRATSPDTQPSWHKDFNKMRRSHSFHINYNDYLSKIKLDYTAALEELNGKKHKGETNWCSVKIIDFAHTHPSEDKTIDSNYIEGIDNLVNILEKFLS